MKSLASHNGLAAAARAHECLAAGGDTLDACVEGVAVAEADPSDETVGYGGLPNEAGVVQLDAAVMHGPTHRAGGVAALEGIRHPIRVARLVMEETYRVLLAGAGALAFARAHGFVEEELLTPRARRKWLAWRQAGGSDVWPPPAADVGPGGAGGPDFRRPTGTVHVAARDAAGNLSCATSTSGHAFKLAGRVGDSPIVGAGLYVDNDIATCGSIGWGEANLENCASFAAVELVRHGRTLTEAGMEVLQRIVDRAHPAQRDAEGRVTFNLRLFLLARDGAHAGVCLWGPQQMAVCDADGPRLEACEALYPGRPAAGDSSAAASDRG